MKKLINLSLTILFPLIYGIIILTGCEPEITPSEQGNPYQKNRSLIINPSVSLQYQILLPESFDSTLAYPAVLALPPGAQSINEVEWAINLYYIQQSIQRNWLVISPVAPEGVRFHEGSEVYIPVLLDDVMKSFKIENAKFHLAGISSGGTSAFRVATEFPERFKSLTVFPGVPLEEDQAFLGNMINMIVTMYVGENDDEDWVSASEKTADSLDSLGVDVTFQIWSDNSHVISSLSSSYLFDLFDSYRP